jgi:hypothetical protein
MASDNKFIFKNRKREILLQKSFDKGKMQEFSNFINFKFVKSTKFSEYSQNSSFNFRDLRPKKKLLQITQRNIEKQLARIGEPMVSTFGELAN